MDGRTLRSRDRILAAARELLLESGLDGTTIDGIAARSGVAKTTIYRQWTSRDALIADLLTEATEPSPIEDTGSLPGDVAAFARGISRELAEPFRSAALGALLASPAGASVVLDELRRRAASARTDQARRIVRAATRRGELPARTDAGELLRLIAGPLLHRRYVEGRSLTPALADRIAAQALAALAAPSGR